MTERVTRRQFVLAAGAAAGAALTKASAGTAAASGLGDLYDRSDATDLAALVQRRAVSPKELLEEAIRRTELVNDRLNCVTLKHYELAEAATNNVPGGSLGGVPFLVKDLGIALAGTPTTGGSRALFGINAPGDSTMAARYKQAGLVIFGKTNVPEFGMAFTTEPTAYGACRNPWNLQHTTGGSSGGSAAAVAAGIVPIAHGTDGGGSIRVPAAACGVFGFKPTRLLTPRGPGSALGPSAMSVGHVLSRTVRDSALLLDLTAGYEPGAPFAAPRAHGSFAAATRRDPGTMKIALNLTEPDVTLDPECRGAVIDAARRLEALGHVVEEAAPEVDFDAVNSAQMALVLCEFSKGMHDLARHRGLPVESIGLEPLTLEFVRQGERYSAADYIHNCHATYAAGAKLAQLQATYDIILQPVTATLPPRLNVINYQDDDTHVSFVERFRKYAAYTYLYNLTGQPSASVPMGFSKGGLPIGIMLTARNGEDDVLMGLCAQLERDAPWFNHRPTV